MLCLHEPCLRVARWPMESQWRSVYVGARLSLAVGLPGPTTPATRVHFARSRRPYGSIGVLLAVGRQAFAAFENLALI